MAKKKPPQPPPQDPQDPIDDFDPELELSEEIAPLGDEIVEEVVEEEIVAEEEIVEEIAPEEVASDEFVEADDLIDIDAAPPADEPATQVVSSKAVQELPDVEVDSADVKTRLDTAPIVDELAAELDAAEIEVAPDAVSIEEIGGEEVAAEEVAADEIIDDTATEVDADALIVAEDDGATEVIPDDEVLEPSSAEMVDDLVDETELIGDDPHEGQTAASVPALDQDPFDAGEGLGDGLLDDGAVAVDEPMDEFGGMVDGATEPVDEEGELVGVGAEQPDTPYEEEEIPKPATHWLNYTLIGLNLVAVLAVPYFVVLDFAKRQEYAHAVFHTHFAMLGLPSEEEATKQVAARGTLPSHFLSKQTLKALFGSRPGAVGVSDEFIEGDEFFKEKITPAMLEDDQVIKDHNALFEVETEMYEGQPVRTIEDEIRRLKKRVVSDIKEAAKAAKLNNNSDALKRTFIENKLLPLAMNTTVADALAARVKSAQGEDLDKLFTEAAERRMAFDFLLPIELFRPGDYKGLFLERFANVPGLKYPKEIDAAKFANLKELPIDEVMSRIEQRLDSTIGEKYDPVIMFDEKDFPAMERGSIEKRMTVAFTLLCLAHVKTPDRPPQALYKDMLKRLPAVLGMYDHSLACELFPSRLIAMNDRVLDRIRVDREGFVVNSPDGKEPLRGKAFIDYYEEELQRIRFIQQDIFKANIRLKILEDQKVRYDALLKERTEQRDDVLKRIETARAKTAKDAAELRIFQDELHRYQKELATAEAQLESLHAQIQLTLGRKGGQK